MSAYVTVCNIIYIYAKSKNIKAIKRQKIFIHNFDFNIFMLLYFKYYISL